MEKSLSLTALAKARIDNGLSKLGRTIDSQNPVDAALVLFAGRAVASSNAVALLISQGYEIEALPILRILGELAVWMRWIAEKDSAARAREALAEIEKPDWQAYWKGDVLTQRAIHLGFEPSLREALLGFHLAHFHSKVGHIPWDHLFEWNFLPVPSVAEAAQASGLFLAHVLEAMELRWPGYFAGAVEIREKFKERKVLRGGDS